MGPNLTVCDPYLLLIYAWALADGYPLRELACFTALKDRMLDRPAVRKVLKREGNLLGNDPSEGLRS